jgi:hypothetical protein
MSFGKPPPVQQIMPVAPPPPPNPATYGETATRRRASQAPSMQFTASVLGSLPQAGQTATKSLLGG